MVLENRLRLSSYTILSNFDIIKICDKLGLPLVFCGGKDLIYQVPKKLRKNHFYIINLDSETGTHWTCLSTFEKYPIYFDSYGTVCPPIVHKFVSDIGIKILYIWDYQLQGIKQTFCGWICIMWLHFLFEGINKNKPLKQIINEFLLLGFDLDEQKNNYKIVLNYIKKIM